MQAETDDRDHWLDVDPDRVGQYEDMFRWRPEMAPMLAAAELGAARGELPQLRGERQSWISLSPPDCAELGVLDPRALCQPLP